LLARARAHTINVRTIIVDDCRSSVKLVREDYDEAHTKSTIDSYGSVIPKCLAIDAMSLISTSLSGTKYSIPVMSAFIFHLE